MLAVHESDQPNNNSSLDHRDRKEIALRSSHRKSRSDFNNGSRLISTERKDEELESQLDLEEKCPIKTAFENAIREREHRKVEHRNAKSIADYFTAHKFKNTRPKAEKSVDKRELIIRKSVDKPSVKRGSNEKKRLDPSHNIIIHDNTAIHSHLTPQISPQQKTLTQGQESKPNLTSLRTHESVSLFPSPKRPQARHFDSPQNLTPRNDVVTRLMAGRIKELAKQDPQLISRLENFVSARKSVDKERLSIQIEKSDYILTLPPIHKSAMNSPMSNLTGRVLTHRNSPSFDKIHWLKTERTHTNASTDLTSGNQTERLIEDQFTLPSARDSYRSSQPDQFIQAIAKGNIKAEKSIFVSNIPNRSIQMRDFNSLQMVRSALSRGSNAGK